MIPSYKIFYPTYPLQECWELKDTVASSDFSSLTLIAKNYFHLSSRIKCAMNDHLSKDYKKYDFVNENNLKTGQFKQEYLL